jgi:undecaprenyl diphosphate synthase
MVNNFSSSHITEGALGLHVAIIMDGSGRWAGSRGLPRSAGHRAGVEAVRRVVQAASGLGIGTLTLHSFSSDNWQRPQAEIRELMRIFCDYFCSDLESWIEQGIKVSVFGRRDRIDTRLVTAIEEAEAATSGGCGLHLRFAIDYSSRDAMVCAARRLNDCGAATRDEFSRLLAQGDNPIGEISEVDLLIRTGGEQRLSDFMLWECAYAELLFTPRMWPDFDATDLEAAVREFTSRERRFGRIPEFVAG